MAKGQFSVNIDPELIHYLKVQAALRRTSMAALIREAILIHRSLPPERLLEALRRAAEASC